MEIVALPCARCGKPATKQFVIDPDIEPVRFCDKCERPVHLAMFAAVMGDRKMAEALMKKPKREKP